MAEIYNGTYTVYCHINKTNGKKYVGITKRPVEKRWSNGRGYNGNSIFRKAINKYGWDNFDHEIIASKLTKQEAENFERLLIKKLNTTDNKFGYNISFGGYAMEYRHHTDVSKKKMSENHRPEKYGNNPRAKKVICEGKIFSCISECADFYNVPKSTMRSWVNGSNNMPLEWIEKGLNYYDSPIEHTVAKDIKYLPGGDNIRAKKVMCDGMIFDTVKQCAEFYNVKRATMSSWLQPNGNNMPDFFKEKELSFFFDKPTSL